MATFKALNIESDDELDDEPDNTKEIQIEEALKIYQNALKYHSQGTRSLQDAGEAYKNLFESEIFKYPESLSEYRREEVLGIQHDLDGTAIEEQIFVPVLSTTNAENAPSTLPQILHLSYKNRGQYYLNLLRARFEQEASEAASHGLKDAFGKRTVFEGASKALDDFAEALDKDADDVDLWRRAAKVGDVLGSSRISRFCLEAVLDEEEEGMDEVMGGPGIEANLANEDLQKLELELEDDLSILQTPAIATSNIVPAVWKQQLELYPFFQDRDPTKTLHEVKFEKRTSLDVLEPTWNGLGQAILQRLRVEQNGEHRSDPGSALAIHLPDGLPRESLTRQSTSGPPSIKRNGEGRDTSSHREPAADTVEEISEKTIPAIVVVREEIMTDTNAMQSGAPEQGHADPQEGLVGQQSDSMILPTRKRSIEAAELAETADGGRGRSKRIRARTSIVDDVRLVDGKVFEVDPDYDWKIQESVFADGHLFDTLEAMARKIGVDGRIPAAKRLRSIVAPDSPASAKQDSNEVTLSQAISDFYSLIQTWDEAKATILLRKKVEDTAPADPQQTGLLAFLEHSKASGGAETHELFDIDMSPFIDRINAGWYDIYELALSWITAVLSAPSTRWSIELKQTIIQLVITADEHLTECISRSHGEKQFVTSPAGAVVIEIAQALFELHLDIYSRTVNPASDADLSTRSAQKARLDAWSEIARDVVQQTVMMEQDREEDDRLKTLSLRHLWTSVFHLGITDCIERDHFVSCIEDIKNEMTLRGVGLVYLPNNTILPELSLAAANREISKLKTMDFFLGIFQKEGKAPVDIIENLEPLLEQSTIVENVNIEGPVSGTSSAGQSATNSVSPFIDATSDTTQIVLSQFLKGANVSLRLLLWQRLREAYEAIDYPPKVLSICLRSIQILMEELKTQQYLQKKKGEREGLLLDWVRECGALVNRALSLIDENQEAFQCVDVDHLRLSTKAVLDLWNLLYSVALYDDYSQAGQKGGSSINPFRFYPSELYHTASIKFHDMQAQTGILLYKLFGEGMHQLPDSFPTPVEDKLQYLRHMHYFFGVRRLCKASDSRFLHFTKDELLSLPELSRQTSDDLAQVLYDLYDLHCFSTPLERLDHGCDSDYLDRKTALQLLDFMMDKVQRMSIKDLLKSDLGKSVEKLHTALGALKSNTFAAGRNRKLLQSYLRSPIRPIDLLLSLAGIGEVSAVSMNSEDAIIASKGWFFLKGQMALARHKAQRAKGSQGSEDELHIAIAFFMQDLEFSVDSWETWFRLAQSHDALLEEQVLWSAEKTNNQQEDLIQHQRAAIHAYVMAVASATRFVEPSAENAAILAEMYHEFGNLIYTSTRQPFSMRAYSTRDFPEKHFSDSDTSRGKYTQRPWRSVRPLQGWKFASALFRKAAKYRPRNWITHYMLGKCLWKIHEHSDPQDGDDPAATVQAALLKSIETLGVRKDPKNQEPILEPIYKTVSVAHKLVQRGGLDVEEGVALIEKCLRTQRQFEVAKIPYLADYDGWSSYMIGVLRLLRAADKARWQHRLVIRAARIMYIMEPTTIEGAARAKAYLIDQHMYSTKTLALTVWKPENERAGRHWCYMKRYALFLAQLLEQTDDLEGIEMLTRRIRKKANEYYEHTSLWEELCMLHLKLHRRHGSIPDNLADVIFKNVDQEEFSARAALIDTWTSSPKTTHKLQNVLRETAELKKLNVGLMKSTAIDDLLGDTYAAIWNDIGPTLDPPKAPPPSTPVWPTTPIVLSPPPPDSRRSVMSLSNLMNIDGAADTRSHPPTPTPAPAPPPPILDPVPRPRARLISRREIVKRASDTANTRAPPPRASPPLKPLFRPSDSNVRVVIEMKRPPGNGMRGDDGAAVVATSPAESEGQEDADDESELSELEEEEGEGEEEVEEAVPVRAALFPNLKVGGLGSIGGLRGGAAGDEVVEEQELDRAMDG